MAFRRRRHRSAGHSRSRSVPGTRSRLGRSIASASRSSGAWHEAINIAAVWSLPVIFVCENNSLEALGQKANEYPSSTLAAQRLTDLVRPFKVPTAAIDGADMGAVHREMRRAIQRARSGGGPTFIETWTVRWAGSRPIWPQLVTGETDLSFAWDASAIPTDHADWFGRQDGLLRFARDLLAAKRVTRAELLEIDRQARAEMVAAVQFGLDSPYPAPEEALEDVFG
jgi:pyruvate dehydrogenase E1 component alpha subunit